MRTRCPLFSNLLVTLCCLLLLRGPGVLAETPMTPPLLVTSGGYFLIVVTEEGVPQFLPIQQAVDLSGGLSPPLPDRPTPDPRPDSPDSPPGSPADPVRRDVSQWSLQVGDFDGAQGLALVYEQVEQSLRGGKLNSNNAWEVVRVMTDTLLKSSGREQDWSGFRGKLTALINDLTSRGQLETAVQVADFLALVRDGLRDSVPQEAAELSLSDGLKIISACQRTIDRVRGE